MTFSFLQWKCPEATGGPISGVFIMGLGLLAITLSLLRGTRVRGALSRGVGVPATATHRVIFCFVGAVTLYEGVKMAVLCR